MGQPANVARRRPAAAARAPSSWPFRSTQPLHATQVSEFGVGVPSRQEVQFRDGLAVWLKRVTRSGTPDLFLRELGAPAEGVLIDLRQHIADVERELPSTSTRDVAGYVNFSLRLRYPTREAFLEAAIRLGRPA